MALINFKDLSDTTTPLTADNLNEIQKANIYSTDEIEIGEWLGKPLYRKVYTGIATGGNQVISAGITTFNIVNVFGYVVNASGTTLPIGHFNNGYGSIVYKTANSVGGDLILSSTSDIIGDFSIIIEYTKTTD